MKAACFILEAGVLLSIILLTASADWKYYDHPLVYQEIDIEGRLLQVLDSEICDVAIIGGGIAGLYAGWRLLTVQNGNATLQVIKPSLLPTAGNLTVCIYEKTNRVGGRLLSVQPQLSANLTKRDSVSPFLGKANGTQTFWAEFGDPNFPSKPELLTSFVQNDLNISVMASPIYEDNNICYLRGQYVRELNLNTVAKDIYGLNWLETNLYPVQILHNAVEMIVFGAHDLDEDGWKNVKIGGTFDGEYLYNLGLWNVLSRVMSGEAYELCKAYFGFDVLLSNQNAAEGLYYIVMYITTPTEYATPVDGMESIATGLRDRFLALGGTIKYDYELVSFEVDQTLVNLSANTTGYTLTYSNGNTTTARNVVLALPQQSLQTLANGSSFFDDEALQQNLNAVLPVPESKLFLCYSYPWWTLAGVQQGRSVTDRALRQTFYYDKCIMATYNDGQSTTYWEALQPFNARSGEMYFNDTNNAWRSLAASHTMVNYAQLELKKLHNLEYIPEPVSASYLGWTDGEAGHAWKPGVMVSDVQDELLKPRSNWSVFIIGEAYSQNQRMIEGDFETAEAMLQEYFFEQAPPGEWEQVGSPIVGFFEGARLGSKMAASADARTIALVSSYSMASSVSRAAVESRGHVQVYEYVGTDNVGLWDMIGFDIEDTQFDNGVGYTVALSGNGMRLAIGILKESISIANITGTTGSSNQTGYVQVFQNNGFGNWTLVGNTLIGEGQNLYSTALSLDFNGNRLAVAEPGYHGSMGLVHLYEYVPLTGVWERLGLPIVGSEQSSQFGFSCALSNVGNVIAIGAPATKLGKGLARVFVLKGEVWDQVGDDIGTKLDGLAGLEIKVSDTGQYIAVGAPGVGGGQAVVYMNDGQNWTQYGQIIKGNVDGDSGGLSLDITPDAAFLCVGFPGSDRFAQSTSTGYVRVYEMIGGAWQQIGSEIEGSPNGREGTTVAISEDGEIVVAGAPGSDVTGRGSVRAYSRISISGFESNTTNSTVSIAVTSPTITSVPTPSPSATLVSSPSNTTGQQVVQNTTTGPQVVQNATTGGATVANSNVTGPAQPTNRHLLNGAPNAIKVRLVYGGTGWVSFGISTNGFVTGSQVVIGLPDEAGDATAVQKYSVSSQNIGKAIPIKSFKQTLVDSAIKQDGGRTTLTFTKLLNELGDEQWSIDARGLNIFMWAYGSSNKLSKQQASGSFFQDLNECHTSALCTSNDPDYIKQRTLGEAGELAFYYDLVVV